MSGRPLDEAVIEHVATYSDTDPLELPPLYDVLDPDALEQLVGSLSEGEISFTYAGCPVRVDSDGEIDIRVESIAAD